MKIARLFRYQRNPLYRDGWMYYQSDCRIYGDEVNLGINDIGCKWHPVNIARIERWAEKLVKEVLSETRFKLS